MWENNETSSSFCSFDLSFNFNESSNSNNNEDEATNNIYDPTNLSNNISLSYLETIHNIFPNVESQSLFNDEHTIYRKEVSTQSNLLLNSDDFDLIGNKTSPNKQNDYYINSNYNNNNSNINSIGPTKGTKRGKGRGSRGSYKPRGGHKSRLVNNQVNNMNSFQHFGCPQSSNTLPINDNMYGSSYMSSSSIANSTQKVCINPEILRRLGYSNTTNNYVNSNNSDYSTSMSQTYCYQNQFGNNWNNTNVNSYSSQLERYSNFNRTINSNQMNFIDSMGYSNDLVTSGTLFDNQFNIINRNDNLNVNNNAFCLNSLNNKSYLDISNTQIQQMVNNESEDFNQNESLDTNFENIFKEITKSSDLINNEFIQAKTEESFVNKLALDEN